MSRFDFQQPSLCQHVDLHDGRRLGFAEFGDPRGSPIFYFHGFPGSRLEAALADAPARTFRCRMIAVDRPGIGLSDFKKGRKLLDWPEDVQELASQLGINRFAILGVSGGAPYALACASRLTEQLTSVAVVAALGPVVGSKGVGEMRFTGRMAFQFAQEWSGFPRLIYSLLAPMIRYSPKRMVDRMCSFVCPADRDLLTQPDFQEALATSFRESVRQGSRGVAQDLVSYAHSWGFSLSEIRPTIHLWHGDNDVIVPSSMAHEMASQMPNCRATFLPGHGHFSVLQKAAGEIFSVLNPVGSGAGI